MRNPKSKIFSLSKQEREKQKELTSAVARIELERPGFLREEKRLAEEERGKRCKDKPARKSDGVALEGVNETLRSLVELQAAAGLRAPICERFREPGNEPTFDCR